MEIDQTVYYSRIENIRSAIDDAYSCSLWIYMVQKDYGNLN